MFNSNDLEHVVHAPRMVCLIGSTRFVNAYREANMKESLAGKVVLTVSGFQSNHADTSDPDAVDFNPKPVLPLSAEEKTRLDLLHLWKIDYAHEVLVLNVGGYIGESTKQEIAYAISINAPMRFLEPALGERYLEENRHEIGRLCADYLTNGPPHHPNDTRIAPPTPVAVDTRLIGGPGPFPSAWMPE